MRVLLLAVLISVRVSEVAAPAHAVLYRDGCRTDGMFTSEAVSQHEDDPIYEIDDSPADDTDECS